MRGHALKQGLSMNEHGFYKMTDGKKGEKLSHNFKKEKDIFDYLNLVYKLPTERKDGRALELSKDSSKTVLKSKSKTMKKRPPSCKSLFSLFKSGGKSFLNGLKETELEEMIDENSQPTFDPIANAMKRHPNLTPETAEAVAKAFGF
jgi:hypothetical protein